MLVFPIPERRERLHLALQVVRSCKTAVLEATSVKDAEPDLNLIHPRSVQWRIVEVKSVVVACVEVLPTRPVVNVQVVPDDVDGALNFRGKVFHEPFQVIARAGRADVAKHLSRGHDEGPNERQCAVANVFELTLSRLAVPAALAVSAVLAWLSALDGVPRSWGGFR